MSKGWLPWARGIAVLWLLGCTNASTRLDAASDGNTPIARDGAVGGPDSGGKDTAGVDAGAGGTGADGGAADLLADTSAEAGADAATDLSVADAPMTLDAIADAPATDALLGLGRRCTGGDQCQSKHCVEGYCCNEACLEICRGCALSGREGTCTQRPEGVTCGVSSCMGVIQQLAPFCRNGVCTPGATRSCAPASCVNGQCTGDYCTTHQDCLEGSYCSAGRCAKKRVQGTSCDVNEECTTGFCVDHACCNTPCRELCHHCSIAGKAGECTPLQPYQDPRRDCPAQPDSPCGRTGGCDGHGACAMRASTTLCGPSTCTNATQVAATCDGAGTCVPGVVTNCTPFVCKGSTCPLYCTSIADCMPGYTCQSLTCVKTP